MSKTVLQFEFNSPAEAQGFLAKLSGPAPATTNSASSFGATIPQTQQVQQVQQTQPAPSLMPAIIAKATELCTAGKQMEVGQIVQSEFGLAKLVDCPPAVQQGLLNRLNQLAGAAQATGFM